MNKFLIIKENLISVVAFRQGEIFDLKDVKYLDESESLQTQSLFALVDRQAVNKIDGVHSLRM